MLGCPVVGVGGDAVAAAVGVVELDVDAPGPGAVEGRDPAVAGQGLIDCMVSASFHGMAGQAGAGCWQAETGPVPCPGEK